MTILQKINFVRKFEEHDGATMIFIAEKQQKNHFKLFSSFIKHNRIISTTEHQEMLNLLNEGSDFKFLTRKLNIFNDQSNVNYDVGNETIYNTEVSKSNLCYLNNSHILVRSNITIAGIIAASVAFKNFAPFTTCTTNIDGTIVEYAKDTDLVMFMYILSE